MKAPRSTISTVLLTCVLAATASTGLAQDAAVSAPAELLALRKMRDQKVREIDAIYLNELEKLKVKLTQQDNLEAAVAVSREIQRLAPSAAPSTSTAAAPDPAEPASGEKATIFANCDDEFIMCLNGEEVCRGANGEVTALQIELKRGDKLTVKTLNNGVIYGFTCVIKREHGRPIITDTTNWRSYEPEDPENWADPEKIKSTRRPTSGDTAWVRKVGDAANVSCESIWGQEPGATSFLVLEIR